MELLINRIMNLGGQRHHLVAKVFGGAHVLPAVSPENGMGARNSEFVLEFLQMEAISIVSQDLGGHDARKIYFHTDSGEVFLKRTRPTRCQNAGFKERRLLELARRKAEESGDVDSVRLKRSRMGVDYIPPRRIGNCHGEPQMSKKIRVLIVDDSAVVRQTLAEILCSDPQIEVMATASDPFDRGRKDLP